MEDKLYLKIGDIVGKKNKPGLLPVSKSSVISWVEAGHFPKPAIVIGLRTRMWHRADVELFMLKHGFAATTGASHE